ncbi:MAG TPA: hypothetical protein VHU80_20480 [Polyangiaceae bacterium]|jgi:hypothetical protein|nr:hypothetical protein [Polyangiaceae bacterium]
MYPPGAPSSTASDADNRVIREDTQHLARTKSWAFPAILVFVVLFSTSAVAVPRLRTLREAVQIRPGVTCIDETTLREQIRSWLDADSVDGNLRVEVDGSNTDARTASFRM